ncbi:addiction module antidote protein, HigA family [Pseudidiomarina aestuarii]|uniref:Addiction module antidote protein, HigA family n=2 Tax=Pseudidiomarina aestuarii TaxID=624146 RepID=A0A2T4D4L7_9GAMM|nr:addiction module antidote protein, HigA family [Pseudidiomarina aestuarii]PTB88754.1 addiction module antidote protein, HigA family [Pseudidiomarina aestuarii]
MTQIMTKLTVKHPGEVFRARFLERHNISIQAAAEKLHMKREQLSRFVNGRTSVSNNLALKLAKATGVSVRYWLSRQMEFDLQQLERQDVKQIEAEPLLEQ